MKKLIKKTALAIAVSGILGLSACYDSTTYEPAVINKSTSGVITGFGSVFINGIEYETDNAEFIVDGEVGDESLLKLGMVVSLAGTDSNDGTGNALRIDFDDEVEGVVISNNLDANGFGTLNILGVTVSIDDDTVFESKVSEVVTLSDIVVGNIIEVSGYSSGGGQVLATRIEVKSAALALGDEMEVKGAVTLHDENAKTFSMGNITIDYSNAVLEDNLIITNGVFVEVKSTQGVVNNLLVASEIEVKGNGNRNLSYSDNDDETELEGVITKIISSTSIEINGHSVLLSDTTRYVHKPTVLSEGMKIKIKGDVDLAGVLIAKKVIFKPTGDLKLSGKITASSIVDNTIIVFGVPIKLSQSTLVKDDRDESALGSNNRNVKYKFGVDDLVVGDWVKLKAYTSQNDGLVANKLTRKTSDEDDSDRLKGNLTIVAATGTDTVKYYIAGIPVNLDSVTFTPIHGNKAELKGSFVNGVFIAVDGESSEPDENYIGGDDGDEKDLDESDSDSESDGNEDGNEDDNNSDSDSDSTVNGQTDDVN